MLNTIKAVSGPGQKGKTTGFKSICPTDHPEQWDEYIQRHDKGTIFHTVGMYEVFSGTPKCRPWAMAVTNANGAIVAMASAVRVETLGGMASRFASRSIWYAEPICDETDEGRAGLEQIIQAHDKSMKGRILFTEVRPIFQRKQEFAALCNQGYTFKDYLNYLVTLDIGSGETAALLQNVSNSCRKQIRKCADRGVTIKVETTHDSIDELYKLVQFSYSRSQVPLADKELFHRALDILGSEIVEIRLAKYENENVAGGITLKFKGVVYAWYGGSYRLSGLSPFAALTWSEIESGAREGYRYYDFGGAGWSDEDYGPRVFKSKFGGDLVRYGRYKKVDSPIKLKAATSVFGLLKQFKTRVDRKKIEDHRARQHT